MGVSRASKRETTRLAGSERRVQLAWLLFATAFKELCNVTKKGCHEDWLRLGQAVVLLSPFTGPASKHTSLTQTPERQVIEFHPQLPAARVGVTAGSRRRGWAVTAGSRVGVTAGSRWRGWA